MIYNEEFPMNQENKDMESSEVEAIKNIQCEEIIIRAEGMGLQLELIYSALEHKGQFPHASMLECLQVGAQEWDI